MTKRPIISAQSSPFIGVHCIATHGLNPLLYTAH